MAGSEDAAFRMKCPASAALGAPAPRPATGCGGYQEPGNTCPASLAAAGGANRGHSVGSLAENCRLISQGLDGVKPDSVCRWCLARGRGDLETDVFPLAYHINTA